MPFPDRLDRKQTANSSSKAALIQQDLGFRLGEAVVPELWGMLDSRYLLLLVSARKMVAFWSSSFHAVHELYTVEDHIAHADQFFQRVPLRALLLAAPVPVFEAPRQGDAVHHGALVFT